MTHKSVQAVAVYYHPTVKDKMYVGELTLQSPEIVFQYHPDFLQKGFPLSPFTLPLQSKPRCAHDNKLLRVPTFDHLFGLFNDSLPDGWGELLLRRSLL